MKLARQAGSTSTYQALIRLV